MGMEHTYDWRLTEPARAALVHIESRRASDGESVFDATLALRRREMSTAQLARALARYPLLTLRILARIYAPRAAPALARRALLPAPTRRRARRMSAARGPCQTLRARSSAAGARGGGRSTGSPAGSCCACSRIPAAAN